MIVNVAKFTPSADPLEFSVPGDGYLHIGSTAIPCTWVSARNKLAELPMAASIGQILALGFAHSREEIEASNNGEVYRNTQEWCSTYLAKVAKTELKEFNISGEELKDLLLAHLRRKFSHKPYADSRMTMHCDESPACFQLLPPPPFWTSRIFGLSV